MQTAYAVKHAPDAATFGAAEKKIMKLTKIDVAEAQIRAAVRLFFEGGHPIPVYTLANAALEIIATIGDQFNAETVHQGVAARRARKPVKDLLRPVDEGDAEIVLQLACHDFGRTTGDMPTEAQIYEAWIAAIGCPKVSKASLRKQKLIRRDSRQFPGICSAANRVEQKKIGLAVLERALVNPTLQMTFIREVEMPITSHAKR